MKVPSNTGSENNGQHPGAPVLARLALGTVYTFFRRQLKHALFARERGTGADGPQSHSSISRQQFPHAPRPSSHLTYEECLELRLWSPGGTGRPTLRLRHVKQPLLDRDPCEDDWVRRLFSIRSIVTERRIRKERL